MGGGPELQPLRCVALYGLPIADAGMIGFVFTHANPMVLPYGAKNQAFCGTNPVCITAPRASTGVDDSATGALCLDMATSKVTWNTVVNAATEGVALQPGWAVDADGNDTSDAARAAFVRPMGEYKGSGLGLMVDVLALCSAMRLTDRISPRCTAMRLSFDNWADWWAPLTSGGSCRWNGSSRVCRSSSSDGVPCRRTNQVARCSTLVSPNSSLAVVACGKAFRWG